MSSTVTLRTVSVLVASKAPKVRLVADNFTFDNGITPAQAGMVRERHRFAFAQIAGCGNLSANERQQLRQTYQKAISHGIETNPDANASTTVGGNRILVNFSVLFPRGTIEIAQTLIHEMMHCAGYPHPNRRNPPAGQSCANPNPALFDCPFDNGQYYGTPPLRAELCIAGSQSDLLLRVESKAETETCTVTEDGVYTIRRTSG